METRRVYGSAVTNLWLHIQQADLIVVQNSVDGFQTGSIKIVFIFPKLNKPIKTVDWLVISSEKI